MYSEVYTYVFRDRLRLNSIGRVLAYSRITWRFGMAQSKTNLRYDSKCLPQAYVSLTRSMASAVRGKSVEGLARTEWRRRVAPSPNGGMLGLWHHGYFSSIRSWKNCEDSQGRRWWTVILVGDVFQTSQCLTVPGATPAFNSIHRLDFFMARIVLRSYLFRGIVHSAINVTLRTTAPNCHDMEIQERALKRTTTSGP